MAGDNDPPSRFRTVAAHTLYKGRRVTLELHDVIDDAGTTARREVVRHPGAVVVLPLAADNTVLLLRTYRLPAGRWLYELPAGALEPGEDPAAAAARELEEETGHAASSISPLASFYTSPGILGEKMHAFLATGLTPSSKQPEPGEELHVVPTSLTRLLALVDAGEIVDAKTLVALLLYERALRREER